MPDSPTNGPTINESDVVKVLMDEYLSARKEVLLHVQLYKTVPVRNAAIVTAVVGLLIPFLGGQDITLPSSSIVLHLNVWTDLIILFTISTISFLLVFSVLALLFSLQVLAERCVWLEDEINKVLRGPYLLWERFAHQIWNTDSKLVYKMPDAIAAILFHILILLFADLLPLFVIMKILCGAPDLKLAIAVFFLTFYIFAFTAIGIYVNKHVMSRLRLYIRQLFQHVRAGNIPTAGPRGLVTLIIMVLASAAAAGGVVIILEPPNAVCTTIGPRSAGTDSSLPLRTNPQPIHE